MTTVNIVMPRARRDSRGRERVREWLTDRYNAQHPGWTVTQAECPTAKWSKGAAVNPVLLGSSADVIVLADADSYVDSKALSAAVAAVAGGRHGWAVPFTLVKRITREDTHRILNGESVPRPKIERQARAVPGGGMVVASREAWHTVNGLDPRFNGWGGEDTCLGYCLSVLVGAPWTPPPSVLWHLWHPANRRPTQATNDLWNRYRRIRRQQPALLASIVKEW